jgi:hypothetical protein
MLQEVVTQAAVIQPKAHNHVIVAMWALAAIALAEAIIIAVLTRARGGWAYIATIPFVNLRQLVSLGLAAVTVVGTGLIGFLAGVWPPEYIFNSALIGLSVWMGIDVAQYWIKRSTTDPALPSTQNIMAAQAAAGVEVDARTARLAADPQARQSIPGQMSADQAATGTAANPAPNAAAIAAASPRPTLGSDAGKLG